MHDVIVEIDFNRAVKSQVLVVVNLSIFFHLFYQSINSIDLQAISDINDNRLKLSQKERDMKIAEDLNDQKGTNQERNSNINVINQLPEKVLPISQVPYRSTVNKQDYISRSKKKAIKSSSSKTISWYYRVTHDSRTTVRTSCKRLK